jgi:hypothetical protein
MPEMEVCLAVIYLSPIARFSPRICPLPSAKADTPSIYMIHILVDVNSKRDVAAVDCIFSFSSLHTCM